MSEQISFGMDDGAEDVEAFRASEADFTPYPVIRQGMRLAGNWLSAEWPNRCIFRHVDQCAGAGPFSVVAKDLLGAHSTAFELRDTEAEHLARNADEFAIGNVLDRVMLPVAELYATNPAFSIFPDLLEQALAVAKKNAVVMYLGTNEWGQRSPDGVEVFKRFVPALQARVAGPIHFRGKQINPKTDKPYGADVRSYSWWVWQADGDGSCFPQLTGGRWPVLPLPMLPGHARKWDVRPGTEER